ncbi:MULTISPECIES: formate/nitrite transporter family protein [Kordiimonas]|jgi:nitrite transporter NirC|uniref:formate/nitrite transporter family protein n=1 Tax=Kordiimonas TaxID=288021 RepID=UPI00257DAD74|nr:formate/nitrite transporter family protein [Kordiimonas sp. UBA4487]
MYRDTTRQMATVAVQKMEYLKAHPLGFSISTMMAGAYVGIGIILILTLGNDAEPLSRNLIMGCFFGITLTLIVFAGAELFSGHTMFMAFGYLYKRLTAIQVICDWVICWGGNLFGAMMLGVLFTLGGGGGWLDDPASLVHQISAAKVESSITALVARAIICNWLICLAIWMTARTMSDTAKCILIFWCLFAFVAAGFEHGVANMTVFTISLLGAHADSVTVWSAWYNLIWVSVGNIIGGAGFIGVAYYLTGSPTQFSQTDSEEDVESSGANLH